MEVYSGSGCFLRPSSTSIVYPTGWSHKNKRVDTRTGPGVVGLLSMSHPCAAAAPVTVGRTRSGRRPNELLIQTLSSLLALY